MAIITKLYIVLKIVQLEFCTLMHMLCAYASATKEITKLQLNLAISAMVMDIYWRWLPACRWALCATAACL
jgi:hypothetical protein